MTFINRKPCFFVYLCHYSTTTFLPLTTSKPAFRPSIVEWPAGTPLLNTSRPAKSYPFTTVGTAAPNEAIATVQKTSSNDKRADQASKSFFI